ncbi:MAG TPA: ElyC/SanA/YdcF family protein [Sulfurovum sp.]|jgi:uncharacterized SAM-binding protein YcdF (DUF218 family)|nr:MAG: hypothetical protein B7Y63_07690 [Sulfurovum sp. 35-42-20]OYY56873.1 MAG: hypothetical protein B7Y52_02565 [Sulfurovum sp. 28-43-6]OYZ26760.1 MAG: hypothetical protein B7Y23_00025 [Sulfurovum sp. 16-42-52]OYZ50513.1 MAG: hypothetical protein B7Y13_00430 [Sulfurovum sp. 24-42-9]OZA46728.1 MAG: hypothetical protein B7X80_01915 [Sulfurovum sp. 17-42-90]OZA60694.1 MAG: hypothetical protein B7X69_02855 [Sulfurovum sp. 39-42-12]HQR74603.1 ElyC/SanA/YdcF family protein [Sulfurovum sp.]
MDFLLKKCISFFLMPLPLGVALILLALLFLSKNQHVKAKFTLTLSLVWLFLFSYSPFVNALLYRLENVYPTLHQTPKKVRYIYVLGSGHQSDKNQPITSQLSPTALVRLTEAIRLYKQLKKETANQPKIIVSGYSGLFDDTPHALMQEQLALALGIPKVDIVLRCEPRDTQEEAIAAAEIIGKQPFILVTSASHMLRAMDFFEEKELHPIPAPTNHLASKEHPNYLDFFSSRALDNSTILFHEALGLAWMKLKSIKSFTP